VRVGGRGRLGLRDHVTVGEPPRHAVLRFNRLDTVAAVWLNAELLGRPDCMLAPMSSPWGLAARPRSDGAKTPCGLSVTPPSGWARSASARGWRRATSV